MLLPAQWDCGLSWACPVLGIAKHDGRRVLSWFPSHPPQAIDLIDEAGSRVRLRHAQLPEEARELDKELRALLKEKDAAVRCVAGFIVVLRAEPRVPQASR